MKPRQIIILAAIFLLLLSAAIMKKVLVRPQLESIEYKALQISFEPSDIYKIEINRQKDILKLERRPSDWVITTQWGIRARNGKVDDLMKTLRQLDGELRSNSSDLLADYAISDDAAYSVKLIGKDDKPVETLLVGTKKIGPDSSFLRKEASNAVYLVNSDLLAALGIYGEPKDMKLDPNSWIELSICKFNADSIDSVKVIKPEGGFEEVLMDVKKVMDPEKKLMRWESASGKTIFDIDAAKIRSFIKGLAGVYASKAVAPEGEGYGFDKPYLAVRLGSAEGPVEMLVGSTIASDKTDRYVKSGPYVYIVPQRLISKNLETDTSRIFIDNPLRIEKDNVETVAISTPAKSIVLNKDLIGKNTDYINKLKTFSVEKMAYGDKYASGMPISPQYSLKVSYKDGSVEVRAAKDGAGAFLCEASGGPELFFITKPVFDSLFEGLENLKLQ